MKKTVTYKATGLVYGEYWGGGEGAYPSRVLQNSVRELLIEEAKKGLDGSLDSGMGYQRLLGALLVIETITVVEIDGRPFYNSEYDEEFIGDLTEDQQEFLLESINNF